jgi:flagellin
MTSINTHYNAMSAIAALRLTDAQIDRTSKQLETGFRVADAFDDASVFAVAQGIRTNFRAQAAVQSSLQQGISLVDVSVAAINAILQVADNLRSTLIKASDGSISEPQRSIYRGDGQQLAAQMLDIVNQASFQGRNQLLASSSPAAFVADFSGNTHLVPVYDFSADQAALSGAIDSITDATSATDAYNLIDPLTTSATAAIADFATARRQLALQMQFNESVVDAMRFGVGALVDSDISANDALLASLAVQKQLSVASLSLSSNRQATLIQLYRGVGGA